MIKMRTDPLQGVSLPGSLLGEIFERVRITEKTFPMLHNIFEVGREASPPLLRPILRCYRTQSPALCCTALHCTAQLERFIIYNERPTS